MKLAKSGLDEDGLDLVIPKIPKVSPPKYKLPKLPLQI